MLRKDDQPSDREAGGLIFRTLDKMNKKIESNRKLANNEPYVAIDKMRQFELTGVHFAQSKGDSNGCSQPNR